MKKTVRDILRKAREFRLPSFKYLKRLDWYIIKKFLGTYVFAIALIISIAVVFDFNERQDRFMSHNAPWDAIIFDYYLNFIPYFANLFSPLFVFIAVIFFTSKLAENSEIIAMFSTGMSFKRMLRPYMVSAGIIAVVTYCLGAYVIPQGSETRLDFEDKYYKPRKANTARNIQLEIDSGVIAYIDRFEDYSKTGYRFSLDQFKGKQLARLPEVLMLDVQGCEQKVLDGAQKLFERGWRPLIFVEINPGKLQAFNCKAQFTERLTEQKYSLYAVGTKGLNLNAISAGQVAKFCEDTIKSGHKERYMSLLCVPEGVDIKALLH